MIVESLIVSRRQPKRYNWSRVAKERVIAASKEPGATPSSIAAKFDGILDGGLPLNADQVRRILRTRTYLTSPTPRHIWTKESTDLIIFLYRECNMKSTEIAEKYNRKLDDGQELTPSMVRGLVNRHDPDAQIESSRRREYYAEMRQLANLPTKPTKAKVSSNPLRTIIAEARHSLPAVPALLPANQRRQHPDFAFFIENLEDDQCRWVCETTPDFTRCCGDRNVERPMTMRKHGRFYSYCLKHLRVVQRPGSESQGSQTKAIPDAPQGQKRVSGV